MKLIRRGSLLIAIIVCLVITTGYSNKDSGIGAAENTNVLIDVNSKVYYDDDFHVRVCLDTIENLKAYQIHLKYDSSVVEVKTVNGEEPEVLDGIVGGTNISIEMYKIGSGATDGIISILGYVYDNTPASGSGYLAEVGFKAVGPVGSTSEIEIFEDLEHKNALFDNKGNKITSVASWNGSTVEIVEPVPLEICTQEMPGGAAGVPYFARMEAEGGYSPYSWEASGLPLNLSINDTGAITGQAAQSGDYAVNITVFDSHIPPNTVTKEMRLTIFPLGDANEDGLIDKTDVLKIIKIYLGLEQPTIAADANYDGKINVNDAVYVKRLYQGK